MKKRMMVLALCGVMLIPGCGKTEQSAPAETMEATVTDATGAETTPDATDADAATADTAEATGAESTDAAGYTKEEVQAMLAALREQMEKDPARTTGSYQITDDGFAKQFEMAMGRNNDGGFDYWRAEAPTARCEVYIKNDGSLYVDISEEGEFDDVSESDNLYFDGSRYHLLQKSETGAEDYNESAEPMKEIPSYLDALELTIIDQKTAGEYTLVSCASYSERGGGEPVETHFVLFVKDGVIDGFVTGSKLDFTSMETGGTVYEYYLDEVVLGADVSAEVPSYFDDIEYDDADGVGEAAVWGILGVTFAGSDTIGEEWEYSGLFTEDNADMICEMLDFDTEYYELPEVEVTYDIPEEEMIEEEVITEQ